jgi:hypothetical protein
MKYVCIVIMQMKTFLNKNINYYNITYLFYLLFQSPSETKTFVNFAILAIMLVPFTNKKENQIFQIYKEIQKWRGCKFIYD